MVTVTVVAMAVVAAAAAAEDVLFNMGMDMDIKNEKQSLSVSHECVPSTKKEVLSVPFRSCSTRKESCLCACVLCVYVRGAVILIMELYHTTLTNVYSTSQS